MSMRALRQLTEHVDQQHREAMKTIDDDLGELHLSRQDDAAVATRRNFVRNLGLGGAAVAFGSVLVPVAGLVPAALAQTSTKGADIPAADMAVVKFAQGLELAASAAYVAIVAQRKLDSAQTESARLFGRHHDEHSAALAKLIPKDEVATVPNPKILAVFAPQISAAADANALMQIAFNLETGAAATYQLAMGALTNWQGAAAVSTIEPIEAQHAVVWGHELNLPTDQWMPAFQNTAAALDPATYAAS
ncbi:MAG: ferritin-like domain-containing protein [Acidimicrobiales bacterium]